MKNLRIFLIAFAMAGLAVFAEPIKCVLGSDGVEHSGAKPYKYRVEYLESTGAQWIDTGVNVSKYDELHIEFASIQNSNGTVLGGNGWTASQLLVWFNTATQGFCSFLAGHYSFSVSPGVFSTVETENGDFFVNGRRAGSCNFGISRAALFALNNGNYKGKCRIRRFAITGRCLLIPVIDNTDEPCMYDEVSGEFFYNKGTGHFIAGPIVE